MSLKSSFGQRFYLLILRCATALLAILFVLAWRSPAYCDEIHDAAKNGNLAKVQALVKSNPDLVFSKDDTGATPLHFAALEGHKEVAALLLASKADVNGKTKGDRTPLHQAAHNGHRDVAELLLANKADSNAKDVDGWTPLHFAAEEGSTDVAALLLASKAEVDTKNKWGWTPLYVAAIYGHMDVADLLLANHADVNAKSKEGETPLHRAASNGHRDVVELLLASKAEVDARNNDGDTPLHLATVMGHKDVAELLRQHGAQEGTAGASAGATTGQKQEGGGRSFVYQYTAPNSQGGQNSSSVTHSEGEISKGAVFVKVPESAAARAQPTTGESTACGQTPKQSQAGLISYEDVGWRPPRSGEAILAEINESRASSFFGFFTLSRVAKGSMIVSKIYVICQNDRLPGVNFSLEAGRLALEFLGGTSGAVKITALDEKGFANTIDSVVLPVGTEFEIEKTHWQKVDFDKGLITLRAEGLEWRPRPQ